MKPIIILIICSIYITTLINIAEGIAGDILIENQDMVLDSGYTKQLYEDYALTITVLDSYRVNITLYKDDKIVSSKGEEVGFFYMYIDKNSSQKILRFLIKGINQNKITIKNLYQYSNGSNPSLSSENITFYLVEKSRNLSNGEYLDVGGGWKFKVNLIDVKKKQIQLVVLNDYNEVDQDTLSEGDSYNFENILKTRVDSIFTQSAKNYVRLEDTFINLNYINQSENANLANSNPNKTDYKENIVNTVKKTVIFLILIILFIAYPLYYLYNKK